MPDTRPTRGYRIRNPSMSNATIAEHLDAEEGRGERAGCFFWNGRMVAIRMGPTELQVFHYALYPRSLRGRIDRVGDYDSSL